MNLRNKSRAAIEHCRPVVLAEDEEKILVKTLDTFDLWLLKQDVSLTPSIKTHGFWESWITSWFTNNIEEGDFVIDIGANCGYFTMLFEELTGPTGQVVAYEASSRYSNLLRMTKEHNGAKFVVENMAVADHPGTLTLTYPGNYTGSASVVGEPFDKKWGESITETVIATTLDIELDGMHSPALIKVDAESAEEMIWNGARSLLSRHNAPVMVLEYSPTGTYSKEFPERLFEYGEVTGIGYDGKEHPINVEFLNNLTDWYMIVVRKH